VVTNSVYENMSYRFVTKYDFEYYPIPGVFSFRSPFEFACFGDDIDRPPHQSGEYSRGSFKRNHAAISVRRV